MQQEGWSSLENGALLALASGQFSVFLTVDKQIERTQKLPTGLSDLGHSYGSVPNHPLQPPAGGSCGVESSGKCARRG